MPHVESDGINTNYEVIGSGPPLLMFSPGGFNAALANWRSLGNYRQLDLLGSLARRYTCITFDRREAGTSGGRVERVTWPDYARQGKSLLDHLGIDRANLMGGCAGCSVALSFAVAFPAMTISMVLFSPAGGARYRMAQHARFAQHLAYVSEHGLAQVVELALSRSDGFSQDARVGPWVTVIRSNAEFAAEYAGQDQPRYLALVAAMGRLMFDRDTVPGAEAEDLMRLDVPALVVPGHDASHATSAARYLEECLPNADYWDAPVSEQTAETAPPRVLQFLDAHN